MPKDPSGNWYPEIWFPHQVRVFNNRSRALLVCGPRLSGKTIAVLHRIVRHLWETPRARVAMFSKTLKNSKDGGPWMKLNREIVPEWIDAKIGLRYTTFTADKTPGPKVDGQTRTPFFRIRNAFGGESECMLFSMDYDNDVEAKLKEMEFSMIYFSELSKFRSQKLLSISLLSLRMKDLGYNQHQWIADTNPDEDGEGSWIYKTWYVLRTCTYSEYKAICDRDGLPVQDELSFGHFQASLDLIEIPLTANPKLAPEQVMEAKMACGTDVGMYERLINGKWIYGDGDSSRHFRGAFNPRFHVVGDCSAKDEDDWTYANPSEGCFELITGWDLGETNHAAGIIEGQHINGRLYFTVLDELVSIGEEVSIEAFTLAFMDKIKELERLAGKEYMLDRAWSDQSSLDKYSATADTFPHLEVLAASGQRIQLQGVPKPAGSVRLRVQLLKRLLREGRFKVSAHCKFTLQMLKDLKKGNSEVHYVVPDENKHVFDAITYALLMECAEELHSLGKEGRAGRRESLSVSVG